MVHGGGGAAQRKAGLPERGGSSRAKRCSWLYTSLISPTAVSTARLTLPQQYTARPNYRYENESSEPLQSAAAAAVAVAELLVRRQHRQAGRQAGRRADRKAIRRAGKQAGCQAGWQASKQAGRQASRQAGR